MELYTAEDNPYRTWNNRIHIPLIHIYTPIKQAHK